MPRPRKSTRDEWLDAFADFDTATQQSLLDICELIHRQAKRREANKTQTDKTVGNHISGTGKKVAEPEAIDIDTLPAVIDIDTLLDIVAAGGTERGASNESV